VVLLSARKAGPSRNPQCAKPKLGWERLDLPDRGCKVAATRAAMLPGLRPSSLTWPSHSGIRQLAL
jgi:hypothetical protein